MVTVKDSEYSIFLWRKSSYLLNLFSPKVSIYIIIILLIFTIYFKMLSYSVNNQRSRRGRPSSSVRRSGEQNISPNTVTAINDIVTLPEPVATTVSLPMTHLTRAQRLNAHLPPLQPLFQVSQFIYLSLCL
jgi:hypothetical protein